MTKEAKTARSKIININITETQMLFMMITIIIYYYRYCTLFDNILIIVVEYTNARCLLIYIVNNYIIAISLG